MRKVRTPRILRTEAQARPLRVSENMKKLLKAATALLLAYGLMIAGFYLAMRQKPGVFGKVMANAPSAVFMVLPFKPMWLNARRGILRPGDLAPDFVLETFDHQSKVRLSSFRGQKPVVLVFGSYT